jgi:hypothetical protein
VSKVVKPGGENIIEVDVAKESSNRKTNAAERLADYWVFGGIYRPVWLEAMPAESIGHVAIDARADGTLTADLDLNAPQTVTRVEGQVTTLAGAPVGQPFSMRIPAGGGTPLRLAGRIDAPKLWNAEHPNLYLLKTTLYRDKEAVHTATERFGFRTIEVRPGQGVFVNGQRIVLKGVNRHSFRPATGRALDPEDNYADVRLMKDLNMNAARMSHYSPDKSFLEAADELGLYVIDELTGWQKAHDTFVGRLLVRELVERDVNHPSIIFWDNGNEGGWNRDLDGQFGRHDPQRRRVLHPWELYDDVDTKHYPSYDQLAERLAGKHVLIPTEILHALYDGGGGAGLDDYWKAITASPVGAGAFIWNLSDEAIARTDRNGALDVFSTYAADGIVGPHFEKEGSYHTVREIWSPVQVAAPDLAAGFDGTLKVSNHYDFKSLANARFQWQLVRFATPDARSMAPTVVAGGKAAGPDIAPHASGTLKLALPADFAALSGKADALLLTAAGPGNEELWTWPTRTPALPAAGKGGKPAVDTGADAIRLTVGDVRASFDPSSGLLRAFQRGNGASTISAGPRLVYARPSKLPIADPFNKLPKPDPRVKPYDIAWTALDPLPQVHTLPVPRMANIVRAMFDFVPTDSFGKFKIELSADGRNWKTVFNASRRHYDGDRFTFPPQLVAAIRISQPVSDAGRLVPIRTLALGYEDDRFPQAAGQARITTGTDGDEAWLEAAGAGDSIACAGRCVATTR